MIKDIKNVVASTSSAIASTAMIVDELAKAGLDQAKALRVRNVIELQQEFDELGYDSAKTKQAIDEMNDIFSALS
jgi:NifU-like protein involved in Fe-S cluster formation